ncbi:PREDICTED: uncharacterized protein LOC109126315 [Camelina sativa]|uniref:Uncharacterized protein LOC109126315 n=1 Tax=Camelina sativa TaxID=90675 RepID=A0ABM1QF03_CAMSA|nr:PREDICTED: uncharacterized protein LOC109126315 [Camelina sativa]
MGDEKLNLAQSLLEGDTEAWFYWRQSLCTFSSWQKLKEALLFQFGEDDDPEKLRLQERNDRLIQQWRENKIRRDVTTIQQESIPSVAMSQETNTDERFHVQHQISPEQDDEIAEKKKEVDLCLGKITSQPSDIMQSQEVLNWNCNMNTSVTLISPRLIDSDFEKLQNDDLREVEASSVLVKLDNVVKNRNQEKKAIHNTESNQLESIPQVSHQLVELSHLQVTIPTLEPSLRIRNVYPSVLEDWPSASMRFNSSQCLECVNGKQCTHHVFDRLCERRNKLNQHKKLNLSRKSWMFKYKRKHERFVSFGEATGRKHRNRVLTIHQMFTAPLIREILHTEENKLVLEQLGDTLCEDDRVVLQSNIEATVS